MNSVQVTAHEHAKGPTGFPWVTYDVAAGDVLVSDAPPNAALDVLEAAGVTPNGARRLLHDARDARVEFLARQRANPSVRYDLFFQKVTS